MRRLVAGALFAGVLAATPAASALCAVEGRLELVRLNLDEPPAFVIHVRQTGLVVPNAFHLERSAGGGLGDIPHVLQLLNLATSATATVLAVGDLPECPDAEEIEKSRKEGKGAYSGRLVRVFVRLR